MFNKATNGSVYWKKVELLNSTFWNVGEKLGFPFSIWVTFRKLGRFWAGSIHFLIFTAKKELIFLFQMAPTRGLYNDYFSSYDFFNLFLFFRIFCIFPENEEFCQLKDIQTLKCPWWWYCMLATNWVHQWVWESFRPTHVAKISSKLAKN